MSQKIAIIDLDSVAFSIGQGNKVLGEDGNPLRVDNKFVYTDKTPEELKASADFYMKQILTQGEFSSYIAYIKGIGTTIKRKAINPDYKANRPTQSPWWWDTVKQDLINRWKAYVVDGMEVDDVVNITRLNLPTSHIVAIDGDLLGLEGIHYNWRTNSWIEVNAHVASNKFWSDMIVGQPGDNIKGLKGRGSAFVAKYFQKWYDSPELCIAGIVLNQYIQDLGEDKGIHEFYKNYACLKILSESKDFVIPPLQDVVSKI